MTIIIVIPYRDRAPQLETLLRTLSARRDVGRVVVCEQAPGRPFNRGWCKNVGFLLAQASPHDTVYFHDVDLIPGKTFPGYPAATVGAIRHLYGHYHCLGGIVGVRPGDFRKLGGFNNDLWCWGGEDRLLALCASRLPRGIDRRQFCLRFSRDSYVREMDEGGVLMCGKDALRMFRQAICGPDKRVPDVSGLIGQLDKTKWKTLAPPETIGKITTHRVCPSIGEKSS